jgi:hypothetical protein
MLLEICKEGGAGHRPGGRAVGQGDDKNNEGFLWGGHVEGRNGAFCQFPAGAMEHHHMRWEDTVLKKRDSYESYICCS